MKNRLVRIIAIEDELTTSIRLIAAGLGQMQQLDQSNDFYHQPFLSLASGFERFMKVILCLDHLNNFGRFPDDMGYFKKKNRGHDLENLIGRIRSELYSESYLTQYPAAVSDLKFLLSDDLLEFVGILSRFGQSARYHDLDLVLGGKSETDSPKAEWSLLEVRIMKDKGWLIEIFENPADTTVRSRVNTEIVSRFERFARALSRLFTLGGLGQEAKRFSGLLTPFLFLRESDLGTKQYSLTGVKN